MTRRKVLQRELDRMLEQGVIQASTTLEMVDMKDGGIRLCMDYGKVNSLQV